jgi:hypothetical protein
VESLRVEMEAVMAERENMMSVRWITAVEVLILSAGALAAGAESDPKVAKYFKVQWSSVQYNKSVVVQNPAVSKTGQGGSETVTLSGQIEIGDPNMVLGTSREPVITEIIDGNGRQVSVNTPPSRSGRMYEGLRYRQRFQQPERLPRWQGIVRSLLIRPAPPSGPPQFVNELQPSEMTVRLDTELLSQAGGEFRSVRGYFHALVAGSLERVEAPFEPNNAWVRLTPEVEIRVTEAVSTGNSFRYRIDVPPQSGRSRPFLMVGEPLPSRLVVAQQFIGEDGKPSHAFFGGMGNLPAHVGGSGSAGGVDGRIKTIRYVIAVDPIECRIPFEFKNVPLPDPNQ